MPAKQSEKSQPGEVEMKQSEPKQKSKSAGRKYSDSSSMKSGSTETGTGSNTNFDSDIRHLMGRKQGFWANIFRGGSGGGAMGRRSEMAKMMFLVLIPTVVLMYFSIKDVVDIVQETSARSGIRDVVLYSTEIGTVIHYLQRERDITALYLSNLGPETQMLVKDRYSDTDTALYKLSMWSPEKIDNEQYASKDAFQLYLMKERDTSRDEIRDKIKYYSDVIDTFIKWLYISIQKSSGGTAWRKLVAFQMVIVAKEDAALERTLGSVFFALGSFDSQEDLRWYASKNFVGKMNFKNSQRFSTEVINLFHHEIENSLSVDPMFVEKQVAAMRNQILYQNMSDLRTSLEMSTYWYDNMTVYIDAMFQVQVALGVRIIESTEIEVKSDIENLAVVSSILGVVLLVAPFVIFSIATIITDMQRFSKAMLEQTKVIDTERRRANSLVYQMLPRRVARALKRNQEYSAERFETVSIFFTSVQGFHWLCGQMAALEVVNLLNTIYLTFDRRLDNYDVYKVETVNDAYMVASGVPKRNGRKHLDESAKCALDLQHAITHLEVPGMIGVKLRLRIGMHTGPCVAGVVGSKMPRYCLFGDTINAASRMCSMALPGQIQVSQDFHDFLKEFPGYRLDTRGDVEVKGKGSMMTHWLVTKEALEKSLPCMPGCPIIQMSGGRIMLSSENCADQASKSVLMPKL